MAKEKCKVCKRALVLDEENLCAYCELSQEKSDKATPIVNCGVCQIIVEEESKGIFCDVCNSWFHNFCNETPLNDDLYSEMNDAPNNVKWFCDKCIWETEKWIKGLNTKHQQISTEIKDSKTITKKLKRNIGKKNKKVNVEVHAVANEKSNVDVNEEGNDISDGYNDDIHEEGNNDISDGYNDDIHEEGNNDISDGYNDDIQEDDKIDCSSSISDIKMEIESENEDSDDWVPTREEKEEVIKIKQKKKRKNKPSENLPVVDIKELIFDNAMTENILNNIDINPENFQSITDGVQSVKQKDNSIKSKCNSCPKVFKHLEDCIAHKMRDHEGVKKPYKCSVCNHTFFTKSHRRRHMRNHTEVKSNEKNFCCEICAKRLRTKNSLTSHMRVFHSDEKLNCTECDFTTKYKQGLRRHMIENHSSETEFNCIICSRPFLSASILKAHMLSHSSDKPFACEVCKKKFKSEESVKKHMVLHAADKPFECKECDNRYATNILLIKHMTSHLPNELRPHACDQCDKRFNALSVLRLHQKNHTGDFEAICDICGKGFRDPRYLKRHKMMHNDERPLKCEICGKGFRSSGHLNLHIKYHKKIIGARCPICGFGAPTKSVLNQHIKHVHTNETPFECDICGSKYKTNGNLSKHKRGIRGSCKGANSSVSSVQEKRESKTSHKSYYEQNESKHDDLLISSQETRIATVRMPSDQNYGIPPSLLLFANSQNSNAYTTQYHDGLIPPNSRGITATVQLSHNSY